MKCSMLFFILLQLLLFFSIAYCQPQPVSLPEDSLTAALCNHQEQIVARRTGTYRIDYYMGETHLNMKTMKGFLRLNGASNPYYRQFKMHRFGGFSLFFGGIGLMIADRYIDKPNFPVYTIGGLTAMISGIVVGFGGNGKFRLAIYAYNKDICKIK